MFNVFNTLCPTFLILLTIAMNGPTGVTACIAMAIFIAVFINFFYQLTEKTVCKRVNARVAILAFSSMPKTTLY